MNGPSVQERFAPQNICFGCGPANAKGLRIRSFEEGDHLVATWTPEAHHQAFPGVLNGGIVGALLDCHSNWAATMALMRAQGAGHAAVHGDQRLRGHAPPADAGGSGDPALGEGGGGEGGPGDGGGDTVVRGEGLRDVQGDVRRGEAGTSGVSPVVRSCEGLMDARDPMLRSSRCGVDARAPWRRASSSDRTGQAFAHRKASRVPDYRAQADAVPGIPSPEHPRSAGASSSVLGGTTLVRRSAMSYLPLSIQTGQWCRGRNVLGAAVKTTTSLALSGRQVHRTADRRRSRAVSCSPRCAGGGMSAGVVTSRRGCGRERGSIGGSAPSAARW